MMGRRSRERWALVRGVALLTGAMGVGVYAGIGLPSPFAGPRFAAVAAMAVFALAIAIWRPTLGMRVQCYVSLAGYWFLSMILSGRWMV